MHTFPKRRNFMSKLKVYSLWGQLLREESWFWGFFPISNWNIYFSWFTLFSINTVIFISPPQKRFEKVGHEEKAHRDTGWRGHSRVKGSPSSSRSLVEPKLKTNGCFISYSGKDEVFLLPQSILDGTCFLLKTPVRTRHWYCSKYNGPHGITLRWNYFWVWTLYECFKYLPPGLF